MKKDFTALMNCRMKEKEITIRFILFGILKSGMLCIRKQKPRTRRTNTRNSKRPVKNCTDSSLIQPSSRPSFRFHLKGLYQLMKSELAQLKSPATNSYLEIKSYTMYLIMALQKMDLSN